MGKRGKTKTRSALFLWLCASLQTTTNACFLGEIASSTCTEPQSLLSPFRSGPSITSLCLGMEDMTHETNFCFRDDTAAFISESEVLTIKPTGCPDHHYFEHSRCQVHNLDGDGCCSSDGCSSGGGCCSSDGCSSGGGGCCSSYCSSTGSTPLHTPRFHDFTLRIPLNPTLASTTHVPDPSYPIGVAINGVLIIPTHYNSTHPHLPLPTTPSFDDCAGHSDKSGTYHYHSLPTCILSSLSLPSTEFPATSTPSPMLGVALDGFPILGPYDSSGALVSSSSLSACNFDEAANAYRFTADDGPTCLVGNILDAPFVSKISSATSAICPKKGIDNIYCSGPSCLPSSELACPSLPIDPPPSSSTSG